MSTKEFEVFRYTCTATIKAGKRRKFTYGGTTPSTRTGVASNGYSRGMAAKLLAERMGV